MRPDGAARVLGILRRLVAPGRREWGDAMWGELANVRGRRARWRFTLGCLVAVLMTPAAVRDPGRHLLRLLALGVGGAGALVAIAFLRYPGLLTGVGTGLAVLAFLGVLVVYLVVARLATNAAPDGAAARVALLCTAVIVGCWVLVETATVLPTAVHAGLLGAAGIALTPLVAGFLSGRRAPSRATAPAGAVLTSLAAGIVLFVVWVGETVATGGQPYDPGQLRDFRSSGARDLATYAVSDNLGASMVLLILVPLVSACLGILGAVAGRAIWQRSTRQAEPVG
ncbi:hypothetical protein BJ986_001340 [Phycicoccus badiiscoriae]|uniref:Uncharacterized protein n=1 Tax=Pedococcus badiiscoriae TaxID=642776 RepID=A0A852WCJ6_9MICO|nr:hypothetical protein [Pedococcus badiiscoriae]NYG06853.1 hypothetical protein [Pedococcus badiiscoriae]